MSSTPRFTRATHVACEPFTTNAAETKVSHGFAQTSQKIEATKLKVLHGNKEIPEGVFVYLAGEDCRSIWGKKVLTNPDNGVRFILVPVESILFSGA